MPSFILHITTQEAWNRFTSVLIAQSILKFVSTFHFWLNHKTVGQYMKTFMFSCMLIQYSFLNMYDSKKCYVNRCYVVNVHYNFCISVVVFEVIESCVVCRIVSQLGTEGLILLLLICIAWFMLVIGQHKKINTSHRPYYSRYCSFLQIHYIVHSRH